MNQKQMLIICHQLPCGTIQAQEALDMAMAGAAFSDGVSLLFQGQGLIQLTAQNTQSLYALNATANIIKVLKFYELEKIYVLASDLAQYQLREQDLMTDVIVLQDDDYRGLIDSVDVTINF